MSTGTLDFPGSIKESQVAPEHFENGVRKSRLIRLYNPFYCTVSYNTGKKYVPTDGQKSGLAPTSVFGRSWRWADKYCGPLIETSQNYEDPDEEYTRNRGLLGANVLGNCTRFATGAFNETYTKCMTLSGNPPSDKYYFKFSLNADLYIYQIQHALLGAGDNLYELNEYILDANAKPPEGGLAIFGEGVNHAAYIMNVSDDGETMTVLESGNGWRGAETWHQLVYKDDGSDEEPDDWVGWTVRQLTVTYAPDRPSKWEYKDSNGNIRAYEGGGRLLGYIANPGTKALKDSGVIIYEPFSKTNKNIAPKSYLPHILVKRDDKKLWVPALPCICKNDGNGLVWVKSGIAGALQSTGKLVIPIKSCTMNYYYGSQYSEYDMLDFTKGSTVLTPEQKKHNAILIYNYLKNITVKKDEDTKEEFKWSVEALAAILGHMEYQSGFNSGLWKGGICQVDNHKNNYGLLQWGEVRGVYSVYLVWASKNDVNNLTDYRYQCDKIMCDLYYNRYSLYGGKYVYTSNLYGETLEYNDFIEGSTGPDSPNNVYYYTANNFDDYEFYFAQGMENVADYVTDLKKAAAHYKGDGADEYEGYSELASFEEFASTTKVKFGGNNELTGDKCVIALCDVFTANYVRPEFSSDPEDEIPIIRQYALNWYNFLNDPENPPENTIE